ITGNFSFRAFVGVQMLSVRQSSLTGSSAAPGTDAPLCIQIGPNLSADRLPLNGRGLSGARQRNSPTGGAAKGMDLYTVSEPSDVPATSPLSTRTGSADAPATAKGKAKTATRISNVLCVFISPPFAGPAPYSR